MIKYKRKLKNKGNKEEQEAGKGYICESFLWLFKKILMNQQVYEDAKRSEIVWCEY